MPVLSNRIPAVLYGGGNNYNISSSASRAGIHHMFNKLFTQLLTPLLCIAVVMRMHMSASSPQHPVEPKSTAVPWQASR